MRYDQEKSKDGINIQVVDGVGEFVCINTSGHRVDYNPFDTKHLLFKGNWEKGPEDYWLMVGPSTMTDWR